MDAAAKEEFRSLFDAALREKANKLSGNSVILTEAETKKIAAAFVASTDKEGKKAQHKELGSKLYSWLKKYDVVQTPSSEHAILVFKADEGEGEAAQPAGAEGTAPQAQAALDSVKPVSYLEKFFDHLLVVHEESGHAKAKTFANKLQDKYGSSIPGWVVRSATAACSRDLHMLLLSPILQIGWAESADSTPNNLQIRSRASADSKPRAN